MRRRQMKELLPQSKGVVKASVTIDDAFEMFKAFALSPLDGRYSQIMEKSAPYFSEYALVAARVSVEVEWLFYLIETNVLEECGIVREMEKSKSLKMRRQKQICITDKQMELIKSISDDFDFKGFKRVKKIEAEVNHDVKAVEYFVREELDHKEMPYLKSFVHIGCTSEDITNIAYAVNIMSYINEVWLKEAKELVAYLKNWANAFAEIPMPAHTHGQYASPTTVGKEIGVFVGRLERYADLIESHSYCAKFNGATGNYSAIDMAFPNENWCQRTYNFIIKKFHLRFKDVTTQIESHDYIVELLDYVRHFDNIVLGLDLDMWTYISMEYFKQKVVGSEVGSSTMPNKVNPIKFENSEGNIQISNGDAIALSEKLPKSRMQRDLSDSTALRNLGTTFGHSLLAIESTLAGLKRADVSIEKITEDLEDRWEVLAEPIQTVLRKHGVEDAYEVLKEKTRGKKVTREDMHELINSYSDILTKDEKERLLSLTPMTYIGKAPEIVQRNFNPKRPESPKEPK